MEIIIMTKFAVKQVLLVCIVPCLSIRDLFSKYFNRFEDDFQSVLLTLESLFTILFSVK